MVHLRTWRFLRESPCVRLRGLTAQFGPEKGGKNGKSFATARGEHESKKRCFSAGPGVVIQSQIVEGFVDGFTGQITRALEGHVLQKVTDTHQLRRLVTSTGIDKNRTPPRQLWGQSRPRSAGRCQVGAGDGPRHLMVPTSWSPGV